MLTSAAFCAWQQLMMWPWGGGCTHCSLLYWSRVIAQVDTTLPLGTCLPVLFGLLNQASPYVRTVSADLPVDAPCSCWT
jgi:hypothetical protein